MSEQEAANLTQAEMQQSVVNGQPAVIHPILQGYSNLPVARQIGLIVGAAVSVAIIIAVLLWTQKPSYSLLFASMSDKEAGEVLESLQKMDVDYQVESGTGAIMVPADDVHELRLKLASQGLPRSDSQGYELLDKETGFGTSRSVETARFQRALEGEIARTVMAIQSVKNARVLLALPKQSVFVRKHKKPSASVLVDLYPGRVLEKGQVEAIMHLVASSVPLLESEQVTVVDQKGRLLNATDTSSEIFLTSKQFEYKKRVEDHLMGRIENILMPIVGIDGMRAQISADVDFTVTESTKETFNPELSAIRSEQTQEDRNAFSVTQGVPGALSNQPPPAGVAPEIAVNALATGQVATNAETGAIIQTPRSISKSATRNFELDKTITHTRLATGVLSHLSVAVVVDNRQGFQEDGSVGSIPYSQDELNRFTDLVKQAVGFNEERGDRVTVTNAPFKGFEDLKTTLKGPELWQQEWFLDLIKPIAAVLVVMLLVFGVLKPVLQSLVSRQAGAKQALPAPEAEGAIGYDKEGKPVVDKGLSQDTEDLLLLEAPQSYEKRLEYVRTLVDKDPKLIAQVIKKWVSEDG